MNENNKPNRFLYLDFLRILAAFSVVMLHSAAQFWYSLDIHSSDWIIANSYNAISRFGVPIFVMISGAIFLNPEYKLNIKRLYTHNILRLAIIYFVWSAFYGLFDSLWLYDIHAMSTKDILREILGGRYHLWFLPMIVGIYVLLPILKSWLENASKQNIHYFLFLFFLLQIGVETIRALTVSDEIHSILNLTYVEMACGYIGYFIWGYYLAHVGISVKAKKVFFYSAFPAILLNIFLGNFLIISRDIRSTTIYDSFSLFTFILVTALFLLFQAKTPEASNRCATIISEISAGTFGVYLLHIAFMEYTQSLGFHSMMIPIIIGIPLYSVICFGACLLCATILRKIPFLGKYIC